MGKRSRKQKESVAPGFDAVDYSAEYLSWMTELSYQTELSRCDSYERLSNCLLSCVSIISVALLTVAPLLFERYSYNDNGMPRLFFCWRAAMLSLCCFWALHFCCRCLVKSDSR